MTPSERGVWIDFLARAYLNDPPGQIDFITEKRLANEFNITTKLLKKTIQKAILYEKIEYSEGKVEPHLSEKSKKNGSTCDQSCSKSNTLEPTRSKIGLPLRTIKILKWNEYQSEYLRQKPYRERKSDEEEDVEDEEEKDEELQNSGPKSVTRVTDRGEERRKEYIRGEERNDSDSNCINESESPPSSNSNSPSPFSEGEKVDRLLSLLKACPSYPYNELADGVVLTEALKKYPGINHELELAKKIEWWEEHPDALKQNANPRRQIDEWFEKEYDFQRKRRGL